MERKAIVDNLYLLNSASFLTFFGEQHWTLDEMNSARRALTEERVFN
jgi:hypothetical protein